MSSNTGGTFGNSGSLLGADTAVGKASSGAHATVDSVASQAAGKVQPAIDKVASIAHQAVDKAAGIAAPSADWISAKSEDLKHAQAKMLADSCAYVSANPLKSMAVALVAGALLSRMLFK